MNNRCARNTSSCGGFTFRFFSDNSTHNKVSKEQIIEQLEPQRNPQFHKEHYWKNYQRWTFPLHCDGQIIILNHTICPNFEIQPTGLDHDIKSVNLISSLSIQPSFTLKDAKQSKGFINSTWINYYTTIPGFYFYKEPAADSFAFSYVYHVIQNSLQLFSQEERSFYFSPYRAYDNDKSIHFVDFTITGRPGTYKLGYAVILQKEGKFQCAFAPQENLIQLSMVYEKFFSPLYLALMTIFLMTYFLSIALVVCCNGNYVQEKYPQMEHSEILKPRTSIALTDSSLRIYRDYESNMCSDFCCTLLQKVRPRDQLNIGTEYYFHIRFTSYILRSLFVITLLSIGMILMDIFVVDGTYTKLGIHDLSRIGISSYGIIHNPFSDNGILLIVRFFIAFLTIIVTVIMISFMMRLTRIVLPKKEELSSERTIEIRNVQKSIREESTIQEVFLEHYDEDNVLAAHIAYDLSELKSLLDKIEEKKSKIQYLKKITNFRTRWYQFWKHKKETVKLEIKIREDKLHKLYLETLKFRDSQTIMGTGFAYVTFRSKKLAQDALLKYNSKSWKSSNLSNEKNTISRKWIFKKSSKATDIKMENLKYSACNRWSRFIFGFIVLFVIFLMLGSIGIIFGLHSIERSIFNERFLEQFENFKEILDGINFFFDLQPVWILFVTIISFPLLKKFIDFSKYQTVTEETKMSIFLFLFYLFINTLLIPRFTIVLYGLSIVWFSREPFNTYDYLILQLTPDVLNVVTLIPAVINTFAHLSIIYRISKQYYQTGKIARPNISLVPSKTTSMLIYLYVFIFGNIIPVLVPIGFIYYFLKYFHDGIMIYYYYDKSQDMDGFVLRQNVRSLLFYFGIYPFIYLIIMSKFYGIPYFVFGALILVIVFFFIVLFIYLHRKIKYQQRIIASGAINMYNVPLEEIKNEYRHPLYNFYQSPSPSSIVRLNSKNQIELIN
eukprot:gene10223-2643_t